MPDADAEKRSALAAALLFTAEPTDRALEGWSDGEMAVDDLADLVRATWRRGAVA
jgi:hypothetical protein